jgi:hypothetical protein
MIASTASNPVRVREQPAAGGFFFAGALIVGTFI